MRLSYSWLKDYVDPKLTPEALIQRLTMAGLEVEAVQAVGKDTVFDLEITPNRPDCLSILGLAREISAITGKTLKSPKFKTFKSGKSAKFSVSIDDKKGCGRYVGTLIQGTHVKESSGWISERLLSLGSRPINNAVDITNFVLLEYGQPMHAFDFDQLAGGKIVVRRAKPGETIVTIDGVERKLDPSILVIADAHKPVAIAGIMGGKNSEITASTKNILLESAHFDPILVRRASRLLGLKSDSSYRFERGVDLPQVLTAAHRAADVLLQETSGQWGGRADVVTARPVPAKTIMISVDEVESLLGTRVTAVQVKNILTRLGLSVSGAKDQFKVSVPSFRNDLKQPVDLVEEVARTIGYDRLQSSFPRVSSVNIAPNDRGRDVRKIFSETLRGQGLSEVITYTLLSQKDLDKTNLSGIKALALHNYLSQDHQLLRPSMLPSLLRVAATNFNRGQKELKIFELGKRYFADGERATAGLLLTGRRAHDWRHNLKEAVDFYDLKGVVSVLFARLGLAVRFEPGTHPSLVSGECAKIFHGSKDLGTLGRVAPQVLAQWDLKCKSMYFAGIQMDTIAAFSKATVKYQPVSEFPAIGRDVSIAVAHDVPFAAITQVCHDKGQPILKKMELIEEYRGDKIASQLKGLVFSLTYQSYDRTLREDEVNVTHQHILKGLAEQLGAVPR